MSYEPIIYIRKSDLEKFRDHIEMAEYDAVPKKNFTGRKAAEKKEELLEAYSHLKKALDDEYTIKFPELEIISLYVELTSKNRNVRELLDELKIEYKLDN